MQKGITCWRRKPRLFWLTQRQIDHTTIALASEKTRKLARNIPRNYPRYADSLLTFIGKLFWISDIKPPQNIENAFFFNIDGDLKYAPFNKDFGPLNLAMVHRYCRELAKLLEKNEFKGKVKIYHYTQASNDYVKLTNSAFLMGAYMIVMLGQSASEAW